MELVISTERRMRRYRDEMVRRELEMMPYLDPPTFLPKGPKKPFLWFVWRDVLNADFNGTKHKDLKGLADIQRSLLDASETLKSTPKAAELPLLDENTKVKWNKSPYQKAKKGKATQTTTEGASTSADAAAAASTPTKTAKNDRKRGATNDAAPEKTKRKKARETRM